MLIRADLSPPHHTTSENHTNMTDSRTWNNALYFQHKPNFSGQAPHRTSDAQISYPVYFWSLLVLVGMNLWRWTLLMWDVVFSADMVLISADRAFRRRTLAFSIMHWVQHSFSISLGTVAARFRCLRDHLHHLLGLPFQRTGCDLEHLEGNRGPTTGIFP